MQNYEDVETEWIVEGVAEGEVSLPQMSDLVDRVGGGVIHQSTNY